MFLRLLFWLLLFYFGFKAIKQVFVKQSNEPQVKGTPKQKPLDIDKDAIEDAEFEELDEN